MVSYLLDKEVDIIRKVDLKMDEQKKYDVIKKLVDTNGNKDRAALTLGDSSGLFMSDYSITPHKVGYNDG